MFDLSSFDAGDTLACSSGVRAAARDASSMEEAASSLVAYLRDHLVDKATQGSPLALVLFYKTHPFEALEPELRDLAVGMARRQGAPAPGPGTTCLVLLASVGEEPAWNDRRASRRHQAFPLTSTGALSPMVSQLLGDLGLDPLQALAGGPGSLLRSEGEDPGVFYVPEASGSPHVPEQEDFVAAYGIRSALGFGSVLPDGSCFAVVAFSRAHIPPATADAFSTVALAVKLAVLGFTGGPVFASDPSPGPDPTRELLRLRSQSETMDRLLAASEKAVVDQGVRLHRIAEQAEERAEELVRSRRAVQDEAARKAAVLDAALDPIFTIDDVGRVVELNRAAEAIFGYSREEALGAELAALIVPPRFREAHRGGLSRYRRTGEGRLLGTRVETWAVRRDGSEVPVELAITRVDSPGPALFTGHLRDITERHRAEAYSKASAERLARIARTLQESLLPPVLPTIPRVELASLYRPAGGSDEPGGDFYDVFETGRHDWAVVLGDVMGKGTEAAALTALVRYTIRAAAMRARQPGAVVRMLNEALHRQHPERFCTVAYGRLRTDHLPVRLTLASGGHPPPLLARSGGEVTELSSRGMLVGPIEAWEGKELSVALGAGDLVVLYSDGVTEARRGRETFGTGRLVEALAEAAGAGARQTVESIRAAVDGFSPATGDDVAVLALQVGEWPAGR